MRLVICETHDELGVNAATEVAQLIKQKPRCVLGLPTGETPVSAYKELVKMHKNGVIDFSHVITFNLDEYLGVSKTHECSYNHFMRYNLFDHINVPMTNIHIPNGLTEYPEEECKDYEYLIQKYGGIDLLILGIGHNGHIGFNEPGTSFDTLTHVVKLAPSTIHANSRFFDTYEDVPKKAITMGIKTILSARRIILMASGYDKSQIVYDAFNKKVTEDVPASVLQTHKDVLVMLDKDAASLFGK
jgi:glucosamine-6-phosphate deaminase